MVLPDERKDIYEIGGCGIRYQQGVVFPGIGQKVGIQIIGVTGIFGRVQIGCEKVGPDIGLQQPEVSQSVCHTIVTHGA